VSEPLTVTVLDAWTREELQPPCEVGAHVGRPCSNTAVWVFTFETDPELPSQYLVCEADRQAVIDFYAPTRHRIISVVRL
jgi:hypothetical protein